MADKTDAVEAVTMWQAMSELEYDLNFTFDADMPISELLINLPYSTAAKNAMRS